MRKRISAFFKVYLKLYKNLKVQKEYLRFSRIQGLSEITQIWKDVFPNIWKCYPYFQSAVSEKLLTRNTFNIIDKSPLILTIFSTCYKLYLYSKTIIIVNAYNTLRMTIVVSSGY